MTCSSKTNTLCFLEVVEKFKVLITPQKVTGCLKQAKISMLVIHFLKVGVSSKKIQTEILLHLLYNGTKIIFTK